MVINIRIFAGTSAAIMTLKGFRGKLKLYKPDINPPFNWVKKHP